MKTTIATLIALFALTFHQGCQPSVCRADEPEGNTSRTVRFRIQGMVTKSCPALVKQAVSRIDGVERVNASFDDKSAQVDYDSSKTSPEAIRRVIKDQVGFDARIAK